MAGQAPALSLRERISRTNPRFEPLNPERENGPLSPALSPSEGERETRRERFVRWRLMERENTWPFDEKSGVMGSSVNWSWVADKAGLLDSHAAVLPWNARGW
jgi:hypothetical protein